MNLLQSGGFRPQGVANFAFAWESSGVFRRGWITSRRHLRPTGTTDDDLSPPADPFHLLGDDLDARTRRALRRRIAAQAAAMMGPEPSPIVRALAESAAMESLLTWRVWRGPHDDDSRTLRKYREVLSRRADRRHRVAGRVLAAVQRLLTTSPHPHEC